MPARTRQRPPPASPAPDSLASLDELQNAHPGFLEWARHATREEFFASLVRAGIYTRAGRLAKAWRPAPGEDPVLPLVWPRSAPARASRPERSGRKDGPGRPARQARRAPEDRPARKPRAKTPGPRSKSPRAGVHSSSRRARKA